MKSSKWSFRPAWALSLLLAVCITAVLAAPAFAAQVAGAGLNISVLETEGFPDLQFYFEAFDEEGYFIEDLEPEEIQAVEDGIPLPIDQLEKFEPGVQFILALNTAPAFLNQAGGISLYRKIQDNLAGWARGQDAGELNDYSLISNTGLQAIRVGGPEEYAAALEAYQPDLLTLQPSMVSLSQALDLATDPNPSPLMKRTILYVTALPVSTQVAAFPSMADRAAQLGVRIQVWLVGYAGQENTAAGQALREMAERTGGNLFLFTGLESFPDLDDALQPLRYIYKAGYTSQVLKSGAHTLAVQAERTDLALTSPARTFNMTVLPPNPLLIAPPAQVQRIWTEPENKKEQPRLVPDSFSVQYMVEFPDGHVRDLEYVRLLVDGEVAWEDTQPPFDTLDWPLADYTESGQHRIEIQVQDRLGLTAKTVQAPVEVVVAPPPNQFLGGLISPERLGIAAAVLVMAVVLAAVMLRSSRRLRPLSTVKSGRAARDPVTQPVKILHEQPLQRSAAADVKTFRRSEPPLPAPARLVRMVDEGLENSREDIPLSRNQITFGSDADQAVVRLNDPSVSRLHARLHVTAQGDYILNDAGSAAGTWVNYSPLSTLGVQLKHGDLIHFGRASFRFELRNPGEIPQPVVTPVQDDDYDTDG